MAANLPNVEPSIAAGIPLTKKKTVQAANEFMAGKLGSWRKDEIKKQLRILDEQDAVNRYS